MNKPYSAITFVFGILFVLYSFTMIVVSNFNMGIIATLLLGILLIAANQIFKRVNQLKNKRFIKAIKATIIIAILCALSIIVMLAWVGHNDTTNFDEDAVIVLGSGVHGKTVSPTLKRRLDKAVEYSVKNPKALIVVSGGQGAQEDITEALAMEQYLLNQGMPKEKILIEDKSTSTYENFKFSKRILDQRLAPGYKVTFITNNFHIYRAGKISEMTGLKGTSYAASTKWYMLPNVYTREFLAVVKSWIFGY